MVARTLSGARAARVVTDAFLHRSGVLAPALESLAAHGWQVTVIDDVIADPPEHVVLEATERAVAADAEIVLGLSGGSSMDVAKLIAVLAPGQQALADMYGSTRSRARGCRSCRCRRRPAPAPK